MKHSESSVLAEGRPGGGSRFAAGGLVFLMALGSAIMWVGLPVGWLWLAAQLMDGVNTSLGPIALAGIGMPVTMVGMAIVLLHLDHAFARVTGYDPAHRPKVPVPWQTSLRDDRVSRRRTTILDVVMTASAIVAWIAFGIWFVFFAGSSLPS
jgi:hypothetical protein